MRSRSGETPASSLPQKLFATDHGQYGGARVFHVTKGFVQESDTVGASEATVPGMARLCMCSVQEREEC